MAFEILTPIDFSAASSTAYQYARIMAARLNARLDVVHVFGITASTTFQSLSTLQELERKATEEARENLNAFVAQHRQMGLPPAPEEHQMIKLGIAFEEILNLCEHVPYAFVVMGTKGQNNLTSKLFGTNTATLLSDSPIPILAVPEDFVVKEPRRVLVALEPGNADLARLSLVTHLATAFNAQLLLFAIDTGDLDEDAQDAQAFLEEAQRCLNLPDAEKVVIHTPNAKEGIEEMLASIRPDLFVMVTHRRVFLDRLFNPSLAGKFVSNPPVPVLAFPQ